MAATPVPLSDRRVRREAEAAEKAERQVPPAWLVVGAAVTAPFSNGERYDATVEAVDARAGTAVVYFDADGYQLHGVPFTALQPRAVPDADLPAPVACAELRSTSRDKAPPAAPAFAPASAAPAEFAQPGAPQLVGCRHCGRKFAAGRVAKHEAACAKAKIPRAAFDPAAQRLAAIAVRRPTASHALTPEVC
jgi:hypothetical protein